jgi:cell division protein FtsW
MRRLWTTLRWLVTPSGRDGPVDPLLAALVVALIGFGVVMVYSASVIEATIDFGDPQFYLKRQVVYAAIALALMAFTSRIDYHKLRPFTYPGIGVVVVLLTLSVLGFGHTGGGAARWLALGPIHIQPSEAAKVALILWLAYSLDKKQDKVKTFWIGVLPHLLVAGLLMILCLKQPDFGGAVVLLALTFTMLFVAGARLHWLVLVSMMGSLAGYWLVRFRAYRWDRIMAWWDMGDHRQDLAYQPFQSVMSFGSGETVGLGLGHGLQVLYLPEAHTDFISAIIGEELGFLGILALCMAYLVIVARGVRAALLAEDDYGSHIAFGISVLFGLQALLNMGVAMSILPTKGLTLPFVSYGGSSLLVSAAAMGILLNVSRGRALARGNVRVGGPGPEASATVVTAAGFGRGAAPKGAGEAAGAST